MNQQEIEKNDYLNAEAETGEDFFQLADLSLTDEVMNEIKGGPYDCPTWRCGFNHNETTASDEDADSEPLDDMTVEDDAEIKGGRTDGAGQGGPVFNHNETTVEDEEAETESLKDLPVENDAKVKGGIGTEGGIWRGVSYGFSHN